MSTTAHPTPAMWARSHLALLVLYALVLALAASVAVLATRGASGSTAVPSGTAPGASLTVTDDGCLGARPAQPC